ncbi:MAG TPA: lycopene cyclase domain-containing protein [Myxococcaceae bacterium]|nr:lycopene cyclase domain-containing protein [Myxococcaceae bacterium]
MSAGRTSYLVHLLGWGLPLLAVQLGFLARAWRGRLREPLGAVLPPVLVVTAWLVLGDHLAISAGVWEFGTGKLLGVTLGAVPLEEVLFFLLTNLLVGLGLVLFMPSAGVRRRPGR